MRLYYCEMEMTVAVYDRTNSVKQLEWKNTFHHWLTIEELWQTNMKINILGAKEV